MRPLTHGDALPHKTTPDGQMVLGPMDLRPFCEMSGRRDVGGMAPFPFAEAHVERHSAGHAGWLRAAVLGANDGLVSNASLMVGISTAGAAFGTILTAGLAGLSAGAMAMAAGEYVSVSAQV